MPGVVTQASGEMVALTAAGVNVTHSRHHVIAQTGPNPADANVSADFGDFADGEILRALGPINVVALAPRRRKRPLPQHVRDNPERMHPGKVYWRNADGTVGSNPWPRIRWFTPTVHRVRDVADLHGAVLGHIERGDALLVPGGLTHPGAPDCTRGLLSGPVPTDPEVLTGIKPRLWDRPTPLLPLDMERIPALLGAVDPRENPEAVRAVLLSLLPPAVTAADLSFRWSSSMWLKAQDEYRAQMLTLLDTRLDSRERRRLLDALDRFAKRRLATFHGAAPTEPNRNVVDAALGSANQPVFVAPPLIRGDGLTDPFPNGTRAAFLRGRRRLVSYADLRQQLADAGCWEPPSLLAWREKARSAARGRSVEALLADGGLSVRSASSVTALTRPKTIQGVVEVAVTGGAPIVIDFGLARAAVEAARDLDLLSEGLASAPAERRRLSGLVFAARSIKEVVSVIRYRMATNSAWSDGIPKGKRDNYLIRIAAELALVVPSVDLADALRRVGRLVVDEAWLDRWMAKQCFASVLKRARLHESGVRVDADGRYVAPEDVQSGQRLRTPRYTYAAATLCRDFDVTETEARLLGFVSLAPDNLARANARRVAAEATSQAEIVARAARNDAEIALLLGEGLSQRAVAAAVGRSLGAVQRAVARMANSRQEAESTPVTRGCPSTRGGWARAAAAGGGLLSSRESDSSARAGASVLETVVVACEQPKADLTAPVEDLLAGWEGVERRADDGSEWPDVESRLRLELDLAELTAGERERRAEAGIASVFAGEAAAALMAIWPEASSLAAVLRLVALRAVEVGLPEPVRAAVEASGWMPFDVARDSEWTSWPKTARKAPRAPSAAALGYARDLARRTGRGVPAEAETDGRACGRLITTLRRELGIPDRKAAERPAPARAASAPTGTVVRFPGGDPAAIVGRRFGVGLRAAG